MNQIFFNQIGRVRSGWRFIIFLFAFLFITTLLGAAIFTVLTNLPIGFNEKGLQFLVFSHLISFATAVFIGWLCGKLFERLPFRALGLTFSNQWLKHLILGLAFGAAAILLASLIARIFGGLSFHSNANAGSSAIWLTAIISLLIFIGGAAMEEAIFRGYILQTFIRARLAWFGIILTSILFASAHVSNPSASYLSWINTFLAGVLIGISYLKTRTLWLPFGWHLTWNWIQGSFLGITVSGLKEIVTAPLLMSVDNGPAWLTGGAYGIEGGIACTVALILTAVAIWFAPFLKPTEEMLALTDHEQPVTKGEIIVSPKSLQ